MRAFLVVLVVLTPAIAQTRFERFERDLARISQELKIEKISVTVWENNRPVWRHDSALQEIPSSAGLFSQTFTGEAIFWNESRAGDSSSLLVKVPVRKLTLNVLASSKAMTEAAYLEDCNVAHSAVALAFLEDVVFEERFPRIETVNRALTALYFGDRAESEAIIREAFHQFPDLESADDLVLLHLLSQLRLPETEEVATVVLKEHPDLAPAWLYYGRYLRSQKRFREATLCFQKITEHDPPLHHWAVAEAKKELSTLE